MSDPNPMDLLPPGSTLEEDDPTAQLPEGTTFEEPPADSQPVPPSGQVIPPLLARPTDDLRLGGGVPSLGIPEGGTGLEDVEVERVRAAFQASQASASDPVRVVAVAKALGLDTATVAGNLPAFEAAMEQAGRNPARWARENPLLAQVLVKHPQLGQLVTTSKELGPLVRAWHAVTDLVADATRLRPEDAPVEGYGIQAATPEDFAAQQEAQREAAIATGEQDVAKTEADRAKRDVPKQVQEAETNQSRLLREESGFGAAAMIIAERTREAARQLDIDRSRFQLMMAELGNQKEPGSFMYASGDDVARLQGRIHDAELAATPRAFGDDSGLMQDITTGLQGAVSSAQGMADAVKGGGVGAVAGAAVGAIAGSFSANPAGIQEGALAGARLGGGAGFKAGQWWSTFYFETGNSYGDLRKLKTDAGQELTVREAAGGAVLAGVLKAQLEALSFSKTTKVLGEGLPSFLTGIIRKDPKFRQLLAHVGKEWVEAAATETVTEMLQEVTDEAVRYLVASEAQGQAQRPENFFNPLAVLESGEGGLFGSLLMGPFTHGGALLTTRTQESRNEVAQKQVVPLLDMAKERAVQAAPAEFAQAVADANAVNGVPLQALHVDPKAVTRFFQEKGLEPAAAQDVLVKALGPDAPVKLAEAEATGGKLEVPMERVLGTWGGSELGQALRDDTTVDPTALTPRQKQQDAVAIEEKAQAIAAQQEAAQAPLVAFQQHLDTLQGHLEATGRFTKSQVRDEMLTYRALLETQAKRLNLTPAELVAQLPAITAAQGDEAGAIQPMSPLEALAAREATLTPEQRAGELYVDPVSGLGTRRAFDEGPAGPVGVVTVTDAKAVNDSPGGGHDTTNDLLRGVGPAVAAIDPAAARQGTNFLVHLAPGQSVDQAVAAVQASLPEGMQAVGAVGQDVDSALTALDATAATLREDGKLAERGQTSADLSGLTPRAYAARVGATPRVTPEQVAKAEGLKGKAYVEAVYADKAIPGMLTRIGFDAMPAAPWVTAHDVAGLKAVNAKFGKAGGDAVITAVGQAILEAADGRAAAHLSGDEFAVQHQSLAQAREFNRRLDRALQRVVLELTIPEGGTEEQPLKAHSGIGEKTYGNADRDLNRRKRERTARESGASSRDGRGDDRQDGRGPGEVQGSHPAGEGAARAQAEEPVPGGAGQGDDAVSAGPASGRVEEILKERAARGPLRTEERAALEAGFNAPGKLANARAAISRMQAKLDEAPKGETKSQRQARVNAAVEELAARRAKAEAFLKWVENTGPRPVRQDQVHSTAIDPAVVQWARQADIIDPESGLTDILQARGNVAGIGKEMQRGKTHNPRTGYQRAVQATQRNAFAANVLGYVQRFYGRLFQEKGLDSIVSSAEAEGIKLDVAEGQRVITLSRLVVPEEQRSRGSGRRVMEQLIAHADAVGKPIALTPSDSFGGSVPRLKSFYKSLGFVENKGKEKLLQVSESMYRPAPEGSQVLFQDQSRSVAGYTEMPEAKATRQVIRTFFNKSADTSTLVHEMAHAYLELFRQVAARPDAPMSVRVDWATTLEELGLKPGEALTTEAHERWARSWEAYLAEGRAPSKRLERAFKRMQKWLLDIYRTVRGIPGANLTPELRAVFDNLLATEDEIARYRAAQGPDLGREATPMSEEEWAAAKDEEKLAEALAAGKVDLQVAKDALRIKEKSWKSEMKQHLARFGEVYDALPARQAQLMLQGKVPGLRGTPLVLDRAEVEAVLGTAKVPGVKTATTGGLRPAHVAALAGYPDAATFLKDVASLPDRESWVQAQAEAAMKEAHPGLLDEKEKLRVAVAKALQEVTLKRFQRESASLHSKDLRVAPLDLEAMKRAAYLIVQKRELGHLSTGVALAQQRAAAQRKAEAAARGDWVAAGQAAREEALNGLLYRELQQAKEAREALVSTGRALSKTAARARLGKASPSYRDASDFLRGALGLGPAPADLDTSTLERAVAQLKGDAVLGDEDPDWLDGIREALARLPEGADWRRLTVAEGGQVVAAWKQLVAGARMRTEVLVAGKRMEQDEVRAKLIAAAEANKRQQPPLPATESGRVPVGQKVVKALSSIEARLLKVENMFDWLDGGLQGADTRSGIWNQAAFLPLEKARQHEADLMKGVVKPILEALNAVPRAVRRTFSDPIDGRALFPTWQVGKGLQPVNAPSSRFELLMMALNFGNEGNRQRLLDGFNITEDQVVKALGQLSKEEVAWVNSVHAAFESLWPAEQALQERQTGLKPPSVGRLSTVLANGTLSGGYFPVIKDARVSVEGERALKGTIASLMDPTYGRVSTQKGHLKERAAKSYAPLSLEPSNIPRHLAQHVHDLAFREPLQQVAQLLLDREGKVQAAMKNALGLERASTIEQWLKDIGTATGVQATANVAPFLRVLQRLRANVVASAMGYSVTNFAEDHSSLAMAMFDRELGPAAITRGIVEFWKAPRETMRFVEEKSGGIRATEETLTRDLTQSIDAFTATGFKSLAMWRWMKDNAFVLIEASFRTTAYPVWLGRYRMALAAGESEAQAVEAADKAIRRLFPQHSMVNAAGIVRDRGAVGLMIQFHGMFNTVFNLVAREGHVLYEGKGAGAKGRAAMRALGVIASIGLVGNYLRGKGPNRGDDEPWDMWMLRQMLGTIMSLVPFLADVGNFIDSMFLGQKYHARSATTLGTIAEVLGTTAKTLSDENADDAKKVEALIRGAGTLFGLPGANQLIRTGKYAEEAYAGDRDVQTLLDVAAGIPYGESDKRPANPLKDVADVAAGR